MYFAKFCNFAINFQILRLNKSWNYQIIIKIARIQNGVIARLFS